MSIRILAAVSAVAMLAACSSQPADEEEAPASTDPTLHEVMLSQIISPANNIWDKTGSAYNDDGLFDLSMVSDEDIAAAAASAGDLKAGAEAMAALDPITVVKPGEDILDAHVEGGTNASQVQAYIDADPDTFRNLASTLADHAGEMQQALSEKNSEKAAQLVEGLDSVCESCHKQFWFPETAKDQGY